ncbi:hypothetical protein GC176_26065 [bacterium]|nr:hypothetical protein [bacterium]
MHFSETEQQLRELLRKQNLTIRKERLVGLSFSALFVITALLAIWVSFVKEDVACTLIAPIYLMFGVLTINSTLVNWHGNPQVVLLLKVVDFLSGEDGTTPEASEDSKPKDEAI